MRKLRVTTCLVAIVGGFATLPALAQTPGRGDGARPPVRGQPPQQPPAGAAQPFPQQSPPTSAEVKVIPLKHAECMELSKLLRQVAFPGSNIAVDPRTNSIILSADPEHGLQQMMELIERLDVAFETAVTPQNHDPMQVVTLKLKASDAMRVCKLLSALAPRNTDLRILPDESSRSIWFGGDKEDVARFVALAQQMDAQAAEGRADARETRFFRLKNADCRALSATINDYMKTMELDVRVVADAQSNTILAFATTTQNDHLTKLINELDVPPIRRAPVDKPGAAPAGGGGETKPELK